MVLFAFLIHLHDELWEEFRQNFVLEQCLFILQVLTNTNQFSDIKCFEKPQKDDYGA